MRQVEAIVATGRPAYGRTVLHLKCMHCLMESLAPATRRIDEVVACDACGARSEFRCAHEAWCASRRGQLACAFPELAPTGFKADFA